MKILLVILRLILDFRLFLFSFDLFSIFRFLSFFMTILALRLMLKPWRCRFFEFGSSFMTKSIGCQSKHFLKSVRIFDLTPESFRFRRELQESGPKISVEILGVEFLTFEVEFRILIPQTYHNVPQRARTCQNVPERPRTSQIVPERPRTCQSVTERPRTSQNDHMEFPYGK